MPKVILPIANGFYKSDSLPIAAQECVGWYANIPQSPALNEETLLGVPGKNQLLTTGDDNQVNRGSWVLNSVPYFVNGSSLYKLNRTFNLSTGDEEFTTELIGDIAGTDRVWMADNGSQLCIVAPGSPSTGYIYTESTGILSEITDTDFKANGEPQTVVFIDGYFVFTTDSKKFIASSVNNGLSYNALDFGTAEADPDDIVAPIVFRNQLFIAGKSTIEGFQNIGGADFPFQRTGLFVQKGVFSPFSVIDADDTFMFIGGGKNESPAVWAFKGNTVSKVSTTAIDSILQRFTDQQIQESFAWSYAQKGAYFNGFSLPTTTLVLDTITGRWHERKSQITELSGNVSTIRDRLNSLVTAYGRVLIGDSQDGRIGELDPDVYSEYGRDIIRRVSTQPFQNNMESMLIPSIELTVESGVGNDNVEDPVIRMDISRDGGKTFDYERSRKMGKIGEYRRRAIWRRNGRAERFDVYRFTLSDQVKPVIIQLTADVLG